jgi:D-threonate/D-erythronate kinase
VITLSMDRGRLKALQEGVRREAAFRIVDRLGALTSRLVARRPGLGLVLTGGDTARAVCRHLGIGGIRLLEEVAPGIPLGQLVGPRPLYAVTKAGAFGEEDTLVKAVNKLKGSEMA